MLTELDFQKPESILPKIKDSIGIRNKDSEIVLVYVGENSYSERQCSLAYYDHGNKEWVFLEPKFSDYSVLLWAYLPTEII